MDEKERKVKARAVETKKVKQSWDCIQIKEDNMKKQFSIRWIEQYLHLLWVRVYQPK